MNAQRVDRKRDPCLPTVNFAKIAPKATFEGAVAHWVLSLTLGGVCDFGQVGGQRFLLEGGDLLVVRPNVYHCWRVLGKARWRTIYCIFDPRPHWIPWLNMGQEVASGFMKRTFRDPAARKAARNAMIRGWRSQCSGLPRSEDFVAHEIEGVLLLAARHCADAGRSEYDPRIGKAVQFLAGSLSSPLRLKEAAAATNMSRAHLAYLFKKQVGLSPIAFQKQVRITRAKQMLSMPLLPIKEIAVVLGFKNPDHFSSCFRKVVGVSPRQYRMNR